MMMKSPIKKLMTKLMMSKKIKWGVARLLATGMGIGYTPASGTVMSAVVAVGFLALTMMDFSVYEFGFAWLLWLVIISYFGFWASDFYMRHQKTNDKKNLKKNAKQNGKENDPGEIVVDEIIGQTIALLPIVFWFSFLSSQAVVILTVISFFLFRLFDIWKPGLIGRIDRDNKKAKTPKASMVIMDDVYAGLLAGLILSLVIVFAPL